MFLNKNKIYKRKVKEMEEKKTIFVTGGSRGIGKEVALKFASNRV